MGQAESSDEELQTSILHAQVSRQVSVLRDIASISYGEFVNCVESLNNLTRRLVSNNGKQLMFMIKCGTDDSFLWKGTVRINCVKVDISTNRVESSRVLSLRQFMLLNKEIVDRSQLPSTDDGQTTCSDSLTASILLEGADSVGEAVEEPECVICMENKSQIILPCEHTFCEKCIDSWNVQQKTCPLCRADVSAREDAWVLTEKPSSTDYAKDVKGYIVGLADRSGYDSSSGDGF